MRTWMRRWIILGVMASVLPAWADGTSRHSGTIASVDRAAGTIVVDEVGPWRQDEAAPLD